MIHRDIHPRTGREATPACGSPRTRSIARALALLSLVAVACFAAEAALPLPGRGRLIAARAFSRLLSLPHVSAVYPIAGSAVSVSARCTQHRPIDQVAASPTALRTWIGAAVAHPVAVASVRYAGIPAYRLTFATRPPFAVYVDRRTLRTVEVTVCPKRPRRCRCKAQTP